MSARQQRLVIVTGMSGAGKTVALHALEDQGFYCIDNLPIDLLTEFSHQIRNKSLSLYERVAVGIDARNPAESLNKFSRILDELRAQGLNTEVIFIESSNETLIKRFSETRRLHPLTGGRQSLSQAIAQERKLLEVIYTRADLRVDTSRTHIHQLRDIIRRQVAERDDQHISLQCMSFGFKYGIPPDADFIFDVRSLPNPHWEANLRDFSGRDEPVIEYLENVPMVGELVQKLLDFLDAWVPSFEADNRSYLTMAIGCTGGHHRSVYVAERVAEHFNNKGSKVLITHRDI